MSTLFICIGVAGCLSLLALALLGAQLCRALRHIDELDAELVEQQEESLFRVAWLRARLPEDGEVAVVCNALETAMQHHRAVDVLSLEKELEALRKNK